MAHITVTTTPQSFADMIGADGSALNRPLVWVGQCYNTGPAEAVFHIRAVQPPTLPAVEPAVKHLPGEAWEVVVYPDREGKTWLWTAQGDANVVYESGIGGF